MLLFCYYATLVFLSLYGFILIDYVDNETSFTPSRNPSAKVEISLLPYSHFLSLYSLEDYEISLNLFSVVAKYR